MKWLVVISAVLFFIYPEMAIALRCGKGLVSIGDVKAKVLAECGEPQMKEKVRLKDDRYLEVKEGRKKVGRQVEKWTYNCGEGDFIYVLTFDGGKLIKEEPVSRGKGANRCRGN
ncbi:MAG: DUF2845 domain-containing protein [Syntrophales bacterium]|nr:DUF2845 domain-containing protein [Syntrophales bacterium]